MSTSSIWTPDPGLPFYNTLDQIITFLIAPTTYRGIWIQGDDYSEGEIVRYENEFYRLLDNVTNAQDVPSDDDVNYASYTLSPQVLPLLANPENNFGADLIANANRSIATLDLLRNYPKPTPVTGKTFVVAVQEYAANIGSGGDNFWWSATSTETDDGGNVINLNGNINPGRFIRFNRNYNVANFGIFPDGTDYSIKMQALIDLVSTSGGGIIQLNPSSSQYVMRFTMKSGVCVQGVPGAFGQNFTGTRRLCEILMPNNNGDIISYQAPVGSDPEGNTNLNTCLRHLVIRGRGTLRTGKGIYVQAARNAIIHDVVVYDVADSAFDTDTNVRIGNFTQLGGYNCLLNRSRASNTYAARLRGGDHIISDWEFNTGLSALSSSNKYIRAIGILGDNVRWDNIIGEFSDVGITIEGALHHGARSRGEFSFAEGYDIGCIGSRLGTLSSDNNSFGSNGVYDGIVFRSASANNQTEGWTNHSDGRGNTRYGLRDDHAGDSDKNYHGMGFSNGDTDAPMLLTSSGGAFVQQMADGYVISGNLTAPKLFPSLSAYFFNNNSATLVTEFADTIPGMEVCILAGNSNTTLQHNGVTFILPGSTNLNLIGGKIYVLRRFGSAFRVISVSP